MKKSIPILALFFLALFSNLSFAGGHQFPVRNASGSWGYIDSNGKPTIAVQFEDAKPFSEGYAAVKKGGCWAYIDESGRSITEFVFTRAANFSEGLAAVQKKGEPCTGYIDTKGNVFLNSTYIEGEDFSEGLAAVRNSLGTGWGYIDKTGKTVIGPRFVMEAPRPFKDGLAGVRIDGKWGFIDKKGNVAITPRFFNALDFSEGVAMVQEIALRKARINTSAPVEPKGGKCGFIDRQGNYAINPSFDEASGFSEGFAPVKTGDKWGYIDRKGTLVISPNYQLAEDFSEGLAVVLIQGPPDYKTLFGYIDKKGSYAIKPASCFNAFSFSGGLALVITEDNRTIYLDPSGKVIWNSGTK
ncbi:MAG TPA: WG repeat-containing protein [Chlorobaculum sp.]|nr:WG repeat-containing protein [Chlorobaculum sp.]